MHEERFHLERPSFARITGAEEQEGQDAEQLGKLLTRR